MSTIEEIKEALKIARRSIKENKKMLENVLGVTDLYDSRFYKYQVAARDIKIVTWSIDDILVKLTYSQVKNEQILESLRNLVMSGNQEDYFRLNPKVGLLIIALAKEIIISNTHIDDNGFTKSVLERVKDVYVDRCKTSVEDISKLLENLFNGTKQ